MALKVLIVEDGPNSAEILQGYLEQFDFDSAIALRPASTVAPERAIEIERIDQSALGKMIRAVKIGKYATAASLAHDADIIVLDITLDSKETDHLGASGGLDQSGATDPTEALKTTTGYRLLENCFANAPVIAITFARNPRVVSTLFKAGAFAVIVKPVDEERWHLLVTHYRLGKKKGYRLTRQMLQATGDPSIARTWPQVEPYLERIAREIVKGTRWLVLSGLAGAVPASLPMWLATGSAQLVPTNRKNTAILLLDIRGFSEFVRLARSHPMAVFEAMTLIWERIVSKLDDYNAALNTFLGDGAVIFIGVYDATRISALRRAQELALGLCELFESKSQLRKDLEGIMEEHISSDTEVDAPLLLEHLRGVNFGLRVVVKNPFSQEAFYGQVGPPKRWTHTILSRSMNVLARFEGLIGACERAGLNKTEKPRFAPVPHAHAFLVMSKRARKGFPRLPAVSYPLLEDVLVGDKGEILRLVEELRNVGPDQVECYRLTPGAKRRRVTPRARRRRAQRSRN